MFQMQDASAFFQVKNNIKYYLYMYIKIGNGVVIVSSYILTTACAKDGHQLIKKPFLHDYFLLHIKQINISRYLHEC